MYSFTRGFVCETECGHACVSLGVQRPEEGPGTLCSAVYSFETEFLPEETPVTTAQPAPLTTEPPLRLLAHP